MKYFTLFSLYSVTLSTLGKWEKDQKIYLHMSEYKMTNVFFYFFILFGWKRKWRENILKTDYCNYKFMASKDVLFTSENSVWIICFSKNSYSSSIRPER
jgi:hypothetical protein